MCITKKIEFIQVRPFAMQQGTYPPSVTKLHQQTHVTRDPFSLLHSQASDRTGTTHTHAGASFNRQRGERAGNNPEKNRRKQTNKSLRQFSDQIEKKNICSCKGKRLPACSHWSWRGGQEGRGSYSRGLGLVFFPHFRSPKDWEEFSEVATVLEEKRVQSYINW